MLVDRRRPVLEGVLRAPGPGRQRRCLPHRWGPEVAEGGVGGGGGLAVSGDGVDVPLEGGINFEGVAVKADRGGVDPLRRTSTDWGVAPGEDAEMEKRTQRVRRSFTLEFKADVVRMHQVEGRSIPAIARDLDLTETAVRSWVCRRSRNPAAGRFGVRVIPQLVVHGFPHLVRGVGVHPSGSLYL